MNRVKLIKILFFCFIAIVVFSYIKLSFAQTNHVTVKISTDKLSYTLDEPIIIKIVASNNSTAGVILNFSSSKQTDYVIDGGFRWSSGRNFTQAFTSVALDPLGSKEWVVTHVPAEYKLEAGYHTITGEVIGYGSASVAISILSPTPSPAPVEAYFKFSTPPYPETFVFKLTDPAKIQTARNILAGLEQKISIGIIIKESAPYNHRWPNSNNDESLLWSYHYDPSTIEFAENAMEVCDATIIYTEDHLNEVGGAFLPGNRWCPWGFKMLEEVTPVSANCAVSDNSLVKLPNDSKVYIVDDCQKYWIKSPEEFQKNGYVWENVKEVSSATLNSLTDLSQSPMVKVSVADGDLIRAVGDLDVYIVKYKGLKKFKRLVLNPSVFNNYGHLKWSNIKEVSKESLASYQDSNLVRSVATGKLYYLIPKGDTGEKRFIADINRLNSLGHDQDSVYEINGYDENYYTIGADM